MAVNDLLTQDEIDALLHGVASGDVETRSDFPLPDGTVADYDFTSQDRIVRGQLPTLDMINERFARFLRIGLFNLLRRTAEISVGGAQMLKFDEYVHSLFVPASLNLVKIRPLRGTGLFVFDPKLVFTHEDRRSRVYSDRTANHQNHTRARREKYEGRMEPGDAHRHRLREHGGQSAFCEYR